MQNRRERDVWLDRKDSVQTASVGKQGLPFLLLYRHDVDHAWCSTTQATSRNGIWPRHESSVRATRRRHTDDCATQPSSASLCPIAVHTRGSRITQSAHRYAPLQTAHTYPRPAPILRNVPNSRVSLAPMTGGGAEAGGWSGQCGLADCRSGGVTERRGRVGDSAIRAARSGGSEEWQGRPKEGGGRDVRAKDSKSRWTRRGECGGSLARHRRRPRSCPLVFVVVTDHSKR